MPLCVNKIWCTVSACAEVNYRIIHIYIKYIVNNGNVAFTTSESTETEESRKPLHLNFVMVDGVIKQFFVRRVGL